MLLKVLVYAYLCNIFGSRKIAAEELNDDPDLDFDKIDPEKVRQTIDKINSALNNRPIDKKIKQKMSYANKNWPKNLERYQILPLSRVLDLS